ncbi:MAG: protein DpdE [Oxalobacteraceae bacterium]|nr:protein DpdE [Oxalobacteraceae bacterium]
MNATPGKPITIGSFVKVLSESGRALGIGKVTELTGNRATVAYFDVPGDATPFQIQSHVSALRSKDLDEETRVFRHNEAIGRWQVGRILDGEGPRCLVAFPNQQVANVPRVELHVRWRKPIADPTEFLARQVTETPHFSEARSRFTRAVTAQRAACRGMSSLLSSSVQLADYQFNVVQRVLQDPVQRYLLADEVGLGKTVEAGLLVRQCVLDSPTAHVLLVVPAPLVAQWRQELVQRFGLAYCLDDFVFVVPSDDLVTIRDRLSTTDMLVVDEAHHLSRKTHDAVNPLYELLRRHVAKVPRLLLLSGTPVLSDTAGFLRILHLLDPIVFPLDDLTGFERRLQSRQLVAELAASLVPDNVLSMEDDLDRLQEAFHDDPTLIQHVETLRPIVRALPDEDDEGFVMALNELRAHLTETYKLHRRILRNRRKAVPWATPRRGGLEPLSYACAWRSERQRVLDELRVHLLNADLIAQVAQLLFVVAVHPAGGNSVVAALQAAGINDARAHDLAQRVDALAHRSMEEGGRQRATVDAVRRSLETPNLQLVVFCDQPSVADDLAETLKRSLRRDVEVLRHACVDPEDAEDDVIEPWRRFLTEPERCRVLVCDALAEEGLNLHGGRKVAVHFDLPATPNRIEQRLGRLDRFGAGDAICSLALVCEDDPAEQAWLACLADGLQVFDASIASLQYLVEETLHATVTDWCNEGLDGLLRWKTQLAGPTGWATRERRRIDQQDALDAMGDPQSDAFDELEAVDADWRSWRDAFEGFALGTLLFRRRKEEWKGALTPGEQVFRLNYSLDGNSRTLLSLSDFVDQFLGTIDIEAPHSTSRSPRTYPYAFRRSTVLTKEGQARGLRPLRFGDPLVEALNAFCQTDDRGRVFAMWRHRPDFEAFDASGIDLWFRFDFLIEAGLPRRNDDATRALHRRVEQHFPPQFHTVWVDMAGVVTMDPPAVLAESYRRDGVGSRDFNLNPSRWEFLETLDRVPWMVEWRGHCKQAIQRALEFVIEHHAVRQHIEHGLRSLQRQHETRVVQIESRIARLAGEAQAAERHDLDNEAALHEQLTNSIRQPAVRTDVAGALFISATAPFQ